MDKMSSYASQISEPGQSNNTSNFAQQVSIKKDVPNPIRLVDTPDGVTRYYEAWILCDDDKKRPFILENETEGKSMLLQILGDREHFYRGGILESIKDPITNSSKYLWEEKDPELLLRIAYNNDASGSEGSWKPREGYAMNAIQRNPDSDNTGNVFFWCKENKHTKLMKMGPTAFKRLQDVRLNDGELSEYDINYLKKGVGINTQHNILKAGQNIPNVVIGPLTEEEQAYERYDLAKETKLLTPANTLRYLRNSIERIDAITGNNWIQKLEEASGEAGEPATQAAPQATSAPTRVATRTPAPSGLTEECGHCHKQIPVGSEVCPECKNTLLEACVAPNCGFKFSVFADKCPSCGMEYKTS
jgi:hypothetical protein